MRLFRMLSSLQSYNMKLLNFAGFKISNIRYLLYLNFIIRYRFLKSNAFLLGFQCAYIFRLQIIIQLYIRSISWKKKIYQYRNSGVTKTAHLNIYKFVVGLLFNAWTKKLAKYNPKTRRIYLPKIRVLFFL